MTSLAAKYRARTNADIHECKIHGAEASTAYRKGASHPFGPKASRLRARAIREATKSSLRQAIQDGEPSDILHDAILKKTESEAQATEAGVILAKQLQRLQHEYRREEEVNVNKELVAYSRDHGGPLVDALVGQAEWLRPWKHLLKPVPSLGRPIFELGSTAGKVAQEALAHIGHGHALNCAASALDANHAENTRMITHEDLEPTGETEPLYSKCCFTGCCVCDDEGKAYAQRVVSLSEALKAAFPKTSRGRMLLDQSRIFIQIVWEGEDVVEDAGEAFLHVAYMQFQPYMPTFHRVVRDAHSLEEASVRADRVYVQASME